MMTYGRIRICVPLVAGALALSVAACSDQAIPTPPRIETPVHAANLVTVHDNWDTFAVDVTVQTERRYANGKLLFGQLPFQYHMERHLIDGAHWNLILSFASRARAATATSSANIQPEGYEAARFELNGDGTPPRAYDGLGRIISNQPPALPSSFTSDASNKTRAQFTRIRAALAAATATSASMAHLTTSDRSWVDGFVLSPSGSGARSAALANRFGQARRTASGYDEYSVQHDSTVATIDVDPSIGAVVGRVEAVGGVVRRR